MIILSSSTKNISLLMADYDFQHFGLFNCILTFYEGKCNIFLRKSVEFIGFYSTPSSYRMDQVINGCISLQLLIHLLENCT